MKPHPKIGKLIRPCPGRRHAWYQSSVGPIRKPIIRPAIAKP